VSPPLPPTEPTKSKDTTGSKDEELKAVRKDFDDMSRECERLVKECDGFKRESERLTKEVEQATKQQKELTAQLQQTAVQTSDKDKQLATQKSQLDKLAVDLGDDSRERALRGEVEGVQRDLQTVRSQLEAAGQDIVKLQAQLVQTNKDASVKLSAQAADLTAQGDRRVAEAESRLEAEKDEMMEAMAQEVDVRPLFIIFCVGVCSSDLHRRLRKPRPSRKSNWWRKASDGTTSSQPYNVSTTP
jgi:chromosome segregation ATPase